jgi:hypothetical protein
MIIGHDKCHGKFDQLALKVWPLSCHGKHFTPDRCHGQIPQVGPLVKIPNIN